MHYSQSHYREVPQGGDFYGPGIEVWAGFGPVRQLLRSVFSHFHEQKKTGFFPNVVASVEKKTHALDLTLLGMREGTFTPLFILDWIFSV